jgi:chemotaxis protein MotB
MIPPKRHAQAEDNVDSWLMSYADMITLLLGFFIIFVSVSEPKKEKLNAIKDGVSGQFGSVNLSTPFQGVFSSLQALVEEKNVLKDVAIERSDRTIEVELSAISFFQEGSADFDEGMVPVLMEIAQRLKAVDFMVSSVVVEGHTSDVPVKSQQFPTNWELSGARASHVVRFLIEQGVAPGHLEASGFGDSRPKVPNLDVNGNAIIVNRKLNERVVIRLEKAI